VKETLKNFKKRHFAGGSSSRHVALLVSGTVIGQIVVVAASPLLTRIYSPEEFGVLAVYISMLSIIGVISSLRYELAIPLSRQANGAANLLALALICAIITSFLLSCFIYIFYEQIPRWLNTPVIASYLWLLPIGFFLTGLYQAFNYWAIRCKYFSILARTSIQQGVGSVVVQLTLGVANFDSKGLILGQIIGQCSGLLALAGGAYINDKKQLQHISWQRIGLMAKRYKRFPIFTTWQALANTCSTMLPLTLFATFLSPTIAGYYILAQRTLSMPLSMVGRSVGQVFHSRAAEANHNNTLKILALKSYRRLLRFSVGPLIFIGVLTPDIFAIVFGEKWRQAGLYAQWMIPWMIMQFIVSPLSIIVSITGHQLVDLISQLLFLIVRISAVILGLYSANKENAVEFYAISGFIAYLGYWILITKIINIQFSVWTRLVLKELIITSPLYILSIILSWYI
jgi:O-antigen/teichoic acid export membrane protein